MYNFNPGLMMTDGGGPAFDAATQEQIQYDAELAALNALTGIARFRAKEAFDMKYPNGRPVSFVAPDTTATDTSATDTSAADAAAKAEADRAAAEAKAAADKAAADKAAADAALAAARTAAEAAAARAAQEAANRAAAAAAAALAAANASSAASIKALQDQINSLTKQATADKAAAEAAQYNQRMSVYASMADRFNKYGLTGLANKIKELAIAGATEATITLQLQETPEYQQRFAANAERLKKGLAVLTPAEYVNVEDSYRQVLRAYGLKQFDNDAYVRQFIANGTSPTELSNRVVTAVQRVQNADPAIIQQLKQYYGIGAQDMVAYVLDPEQEFPKIERQIAASEIGVAAGRQGLTAGVSVAEQLAAQGVTEAQAQKGYATIADILPTAEKLSDIYGTTLDEYRQSEGEQEVFNQLASAQRKRQRLTAREVAAFSCYAGTNRTSLTTSTVATATTLTYAVNNITVNNYTGAAAQAVTLPAARAGVIVIHAQSVDTTGGTAKLIFDCAGTDVFATGSIIESRATSALTIDTSAAGETSLEYTPANAVTNLFSQGSYLYFSCAQDGTWTIAYKMQPNPASTGLTGAFAFAA